MVKQRERAENKTNLTAFENGADKSPVESDMRPNAPKKYKSMTIHFNAYEFDRISAACNETGQSKLSYIRDAINTSLDK